MTSIQHKPLDINEVLTRLQDCFNYLVVLKAATQEQEEQRIFDIVEELDNIYSKIKSQKAATYEIIGVEQ